MNEIRQLKIEDIDFYVDHLARHLPEPGIDGIISQPFPPDFSVDKEKFKNKILQRWSEVPGNGTWEVAWGIFIDDAIIGHLELIGSAFDALKHRAKLGMGIEAQFRSKGNGRRLMKISMDWAQKQSFLSWIDIEVFAHNEAALKLYNSFGYQLIGKTPDRIRVNGQSIDDLHLVYSLKNVQPDAIPGMKNLKINLDIPKYHFDLNLREVPESFEEYRKFIEKCRSELDRHSAEDRKPILAKLGFALRLTEQFSEAKKVFKEGISLCTLSNIGHLINAKIRLAHVYQREGLFVLSNEIFEEIEQLYLNDAIPISIQGTYWQHRGKNEFDQKNFSKALEYFEMALTIRERDKTPFDQLESSRLAIKRTKDLLVLYLDGETTLIRRAVLSDAEQIHQAHMRSIQEVCSKDHSDAEIKAWGYRPFNKDQRESAIKNDFVWVLEERNSLQGYGHLRLFEKNGIKSGHILGLYLTAQVLGRNFGQKILDLMKEAAQEYGAKEIILESTITAHSFYSMHGFRDKGPMTLIQIGGQDVRCYPMVLNMPEQ